MTIATAEFLPVNLRDVRPIEKAHAIFDQFIDRLAKDDPADHLELVAMSKAFGISLGDVHTSLKLMALRDSITPAQRKAAKAEADAAESEYSALQREREEWMRQFMPRLQAGKAKLEAAKARIADMDRAASVTVTGNKIASLVYARRKAVK